MNLLAILYSFHSSLNAVFFQRFSVAFLLRTKFCVLNETNAFLERGIGVKKRKAWCRSAWNKRGELQAPRAYWSAPKCLADRTSRAPLPLQLRPDPTVAAAAAVRRGPPVAHIVCLGSVHGATVAGKGVGSRCPLQPPVQLVAPAASPGIGLPARFQRTRVDCLRRSLVICSVSTGRRRTNIGLIIVRLPVCTRSLEKDNHGVYYGLMEFME